ncbi:MAG TPA: L,D-transpeptidase family protein [Myxococcales bacterium]|nr:L,D-transpeptidase family protein [Myxococcales bacterium]
MPRTRTFAVAILAAALLVPPVSAAGPQPRANDPVWGAALDAARIPGGEYAVLRAAYEERAGLLWMDDGAPSPQAIALAALIARAGERGLSADDYGGTAPALHIASAAGSSVSERAAIDVAFSSVVLAFVSDLGLGRVHPQEARWHLAAVRSELPLAKLIAGLAAASDVDAELDAIEMPLAIHVRTRLALALYRALAERGEGPPLHAWKRTIAPGDASAGLDALAARLDLLGDLPAGTVIPARYEGPLVVAVQQFQERHGFTADGLIDRGTYQALAVPLARRVQQLSLSLERMRWIPRHLASPLIVVNIPEFALHAVSTSGRPGLDMKVVVGRSHDHRTPMFVDDVQAVQFHPYWNVPANIAKDQLLNRLLAHPANALAQGFELVERDGKVRAWPADAQSRSRGGAGPLRLRQRPGPLNALGPVKLEMPNPYAIYLHGTPSQGLFAREKRDFSHGCIRVEDPSALATWALLETPGWSEERVHAAIAAGESLRVPLTTPIHVLILYTTTVVGEDGRVSFYDDVYGNDAVLEKSIEHASAARRARAMSAATFASDARTASR